MDGIAFSEPRTFVEGENILTKTATDRAGNTGSASVSVYLLFRPAYQTRRRRGIITGWKVKSNYSSRCLSEPKQIKIFTLNKETLQNAAPNSTSLLSVVECKPYGLVFNKPISIIYTLYQAEISSTPGELGLYDAVQKKLFPQVRLQLFRLMAIL